jgi:hypothetical protein
VPGITSTEPTPWSRTAFQVLSIVEFLSAENQEAAYESQRAAQQAAWVQYCLEKDGSSGLVEGQQPGRPSLEPMTGPQMAAVGRALPASPRELD